MARLMCRETPDNDYLIADERRYDQWIRRAARFKSSLALSIKFMKVLLLIIILIFSFDLRQAIGAMTPNAFHKPNKCLQKETANLAVFAVSYNDGFKSKPNEQILKEVEMWMPFRKLECANGYG